MSTTSRNKRKQKLSPYHGRKMAQPGEQNTKEAQEWRERPEGAGGLGRVTGLGCRGWTAGRHRLHSDCLDLTNPRLRPCCALNAVSYIRARTVISRLASGHRLRVAIV